jgi:hypothetical protein
MVSNVSLDKHISSNNVLYTKLQHNWKQFQQMNPNYLTEAQETKHGKTLKDLY